MLSKPPLNKCPLCQTAKVSIIDDSITEGLKYLHCERCLYYLHYDERDKFLTYAFVSFNLDTDITVSLWFSNNTYEINEIHHKSLIEGKMPEIDWSNGKEIIRIFKSILKLKAFV